MTVDGVAIWSVPDDRDAGCASEPDPIVGEDRVVGGGPGAGESLGDPDHGSDAARRCLPRPPQTRPRQLRPRLGRRSSVLAPHLSTLEAPVATHDHCQGGGSPAHGSCARRRITVSRPRPSPPQRRHQRSSSTTRRARTARSGSSH